MAVLVILPKFRWDQSVVVSEQKLSNPIKVVKGAVLKRPLGRYASKAKKSKLEQEVLSSSSTVISIAIERKNNLLESKNAVFKSALVEQQGTTHERLVLLRHAKWTKEATLWAKLGDNVKATEMLQRIRDDRKKESEKLVEDVAVAGVPLDISVTVPIPSVANNNNSITKNQSS